jgi:hypothetical protein
VSETLEIVEIGLTGITSLVALENQVFISSKSDTVTRVVFDRVCF